MIRFLQTEGPMKKIVLGGLLLVVCVMMVITLVPGGMFGDYFGRDIRHCRRCGHRDYWYPGYVCLDEIDSPHRVRVGSRIQQGVQVIRKGAHRAVPVESVADRSCHRPR